MAVPAWARCVKHCWLAVETGTALMAVIMKPTSLRRTDQAALDPDRAAVRHCDKPSSVTPGGCREVQDRSRDLLPPAVTSITRLPSENYIRPHLTAERHVLRTQIEPGCSLRRSGGTISGRFRQSQLENKAISQRVVSIRSAFKR
jgi:hypothetical protein